jgi:hypothetical protein
LVEAAGAGSAVRDYALASRLDIREFAIGDMVSSVKNIES